MEKLGIIAFISFFIFMLYNDNNRIVDVHICEHRGVSTYVSRNEPPQELKFGSCRVEVMPNSRYYRLRQTIRHGVK